jgi:hypothetical protein
MYEKSLNVRIVGETDKHNAVIAHANNDPANFRREQRAHLRSTIEMVEKEAGSAQHGETHRMVIRARKELRAMLTGSQVKPEHAKGFSTKPGFKDDIDWEEHPPENEIVEDPAMAAQRDLIERNKRYGFSTFAKGVGWADLQAPPSENPVSFVSAKARDERNEIERKKDTKIFSVSPEDLPLNLRLAVFDAQMVKEKAEQEKLLLRKTKADENTPERRRKQKRMGGRGEGEGVQELSLHQQESSNHHTREKNKKKVIPRNTLPEVRLGPALHIDPVAQHQLPIHTMSQPDAHILSEAPRVSEKKSKKKKVSQEQMEGSTTSKIEKGKDVANLDDDNAASKRDQQKRREKKKKRPQPFKYTRMLLCPCFVVYRSLQKVFFLS